MKKLRDRLNKKGFTLVELIVVIVIILILAAALVPNVMRYIRQARMSAFQAEASAYLVEIQGFEAEYYGTNNVDLPVGASLPSGMTLSDFTNGEFNATATTKKYTSVTPAAGDNVEMPENKKGIYVTCNKGIVVSFSYSNGKHFVNWTQTGGWDDVDEKP